MTNPKRISKTPVLLYGRINPELRVSDDELKILVDKYRFRRWREPKKPRCQARARGDSQFAIEGNIHKDGGYRCMSQATHCGLCGKHYARATSGVRKIAAAMEVCEQTVYVR